MSLTANSQRYGAKALIERDGEVLLTREQRSDDSIYYSLPGGGINPNESARDAVKRELTEEIGCFGTVKSRIGSCSYSHQSMKATTEYEVFTVRLLGNPTPNASEGVVDAEFYHPSALPALTIEPLAETVRENTTQTIDN